VHRVLQSVSDRQLHRHTRKIASLHGQSDILDFLTVILSYGVRCMKPSAVENIRSKRQSNKGI